MKIFREKMNPGLNFYFVKMLRHKAVEEKAALLGCAVAGGALTEANIWRRTLF